MYGTEIARVMTHQNGYTVETKTAQKKKPTGNNNKLSGVYPSDTSAPMPDHDWESHVATSKKDVLDRVAAAHAAHQDSLLTGKMRSLKK